MVFETTLYVVEGQVREERILHGFKRFCERSQRFNKTQSSIHYRRLYLWTLICVLKEIEMMPRDLLTVEGSKFFLIFEHLILPFNYHFLKDFSFASNS